RRSNTGCPRRERAAARHRAAHAARVPRGRLRADGGVLRRSGLPVLRRPVQPGGGLAQVRGYPGHWALRGYGPWALERKDTGAFVGLCGPWYPEGWIEPEITWALMPGHHGLGFATEA